MFKRIYRELRHPTICVKRPVRIITLSIVAAYLLFALVLQVSK